ncbi:MAG: RluA family pseudouridine synthase [Vicinamibacterales bacterium]
MSPPAPIAILYEDASLVVVDKPSGVPVVPAPGTAEGECLRDRVAATIGTRTWVVHRLDRDTSGVVVFARTAEAHRALSMAFEARDVGKQYLAFVRGCPDPPSGRIDVPLHDARRGRTRPAARGEAGAREAATGYGVVSVWRSGAAAISAVRAAPHTGRRHQIRVHLRAIGTPILADPIYGGGIAVPPFEGPASRLALHAASIGFPHPVSGRRVVVDAPLPADLAALDAWLDAHWTREAGS